jgi:hypothetical protein
VISIFARGGTRRSSAASSGVMQAGVGEELHLEPQAAGGEVELSEVGAQQGLAAGEAHREGAEAGGLPKEVHCHWAVVSSRALGGPRRRPAG